MHDLSAIWPAQPDWRAAALDRPGLSVRPAPGLAQHLISGDFAAWARQASFPHADIGGFGLAQGDRYCVRLARDRVLAVGPSDFVAPSGWRAEGFAATPISAGLLVFEMRGPLAPGVLARATALDPSKTSPSAAMNFAGTQAIVYRYRDPDTARIHIDRPMGPHFWTWLAAVVENFAPAEDGRG